ncbi:MAG: hypothetical protein HY721_09810 [Planctomycetes bacterium]|nr:hypothetical protein [Planctomycetota bacterium]
MRRILPRAFALLSLPAIFWLVLLAGRGGMTAPPPKTANRYIGSEKCKNCHQAKKAGGQFSKWKEMKHAKAFDVLASDEGKKTAKAKGVDDPQKSPKCIKCHVTAFEVPAEQIAKGFNPKHGVQCESCHGPGEKHFKARFAAAGDEEPSEDKEYEEIPDDEIVKRPPLKKCLECHNEESPNFKDFCLKKRYTDVAHLDPRKSRTEAELAAMKCGCGEKCSCKKGECGELEEKKGTKEKSGD